MFQQLRAFVAGGLGFVGVVELGVGEEFAAEFVDVGAGFVDAVIEEVVEGV